MKSLKAWMAVIIVTVVITTAVFALTRTGGGGSVAAPEKVTASTLCPVAGCAAPTCHGAGPAPSLNEGSTMTCPKVGCQDDSCHAADRLTSHYRAPKNASLNVWLVGLSVFTLAMVAVAAYVR